jgi:two-component system response regulator RegX3
MRTKDHLPERILIVDDDASVREMLSRVLEEEGYHTVRAADGPEALDIAATIRIDLVLLDLNLPGKSGWDTFEILTSDNPFLPVIIVTARSNQIFTALSAGVGALLEKPLSFPKLLETIDTLLKESNESRLARMAGRPAEFRYLPPQKKVRP